MTSQNNKILAERLMNNGSLLHKTLDHINNTEELVSLINLTIEWSSSIEDFARMTSGELVYDLYLRKLSKGGTILDYIIKYKSPNGNFNNQADLNYIDKVRRTIDVNMEFLRENINKFPIKREVFTLCKNGNLLSSEGVIIRRMEIESLPFKVLKHLCTAKSIKPNDLPPSLKNYSGDFGKAVGNFNEDFKKKTEYKSNLLTGFDRNGYKVVEIFSIQYSK